MKTYILLDLLCLVFYVYKVNNKGVCALDVVGGMVVFVVVDM